MYRILAATAFAGLLGMTSTSVGAEPVKKYLHLTNTCKHDIFVSTGTSYQEDGGVAYFTQGWFKLVPGKKSKIFFGLDTWKYNWLNVRASGKALGNNDVTFCGSLKRFVVTMVSGGGSPTEFTGTIGTAPQKRGTTCADVGGEDLGSYQYLGESTGDITVNWEQCLP